MIKYYARLNNAVQIVVATSHWDAMRQGRAWFRDSRVRVVPVS